MKVNTPLEKNEKGTAKSGRFPFFYLKEEKKKLQILVTYTREILLFLL